VLSAPKQQLPATLSGKQPSGIPLVDASPELAWLLLALLAGEVGVRIFRLLRERRAQGAAIQPSSS
jgi:hypothetical protein